MCGIVAIHGETNESLAREMLGRLAHRGPDGQGLFRIGQTTLGHARLAILDLPGGAQPMTNERGDLAVAFNGEIYNHSLLRRGLESRHVFKTRSDTEALIHLYEEEGEDMLARLDGMFALALAGPKGLLLARDPLGIKPLYHGRKGDCIFAASELKAFPPIDELHALPAGRWMRIGEPPQPFGPLFPPRPPIVDMSLPDALCETRLRLEAAVLKRLMGDVPVGVYLSGGLDSSLVAAFMRPHTVELHSFTAGIQGAPDLEAAREMARYLDTAHHELVYTEDDMEAALPEIIRHLESFDAPLVRSAIPMYFISKLASQHVKVVLTGEGADELFAGYEYLNGLGGGSMLAEERVRIIERLQDTNLQRADRMTMAHGIEARVPFLDFGFLRFVLRLPIEWIEPREDRPEKWFLREACRGILPRTILDRKKMKFSDGAGSSRSMAERLRRRASANDFAAEEREAARLNLRSPEELHYHRIWRDVMGCPLPDALVGRTSDPKAAVESSRGV